MKKIACILAVMALAVASYAEQFVNTLEVPAAGSSVAFTNTYNQVINIASGINGFSGTTPTANNVVGNITRTAGATTATLAVFASGTTTNVSTSFKVNDLIGINPGEVITITNSAASATVLSLTVKTTK